MTATPRTYYDLGVILYHINLESGVILERKSGVLMHISSLPGDYSIGSFGRHAKAFVDFI